MRHLVRWVAASTLALAVSVILATPASAHAQLETTDPVQSSVVATSPRSVTLHFGEPVEIDFGSLGVIAPDGSRVDNGGAYHPAGDTHSVSVSLPSSLARGTYVVAWRVISDDSHPVHGAFVFSVGAAGGAAKASSLANILGNASGSRAVGAVYWLVRLGTFASLVFLTGVAVILMVAWPEGARTRRLGRLLWTLWAILAFCTVAGVAVQGVYAAGLPLTDVAHPSLFSAVLHTRFGEVELLRLVLLVAFAPVILGLQGKLASGSPWWIAVGALAAVGLLVTPGLSGHAATQGNALLGVALDTTHLAAVSAWFGGLALLGALVLPGLPEHERPPYPWTIALRVSSIAFWAVLAVVGTGVLQAIREVGSFYALFNTDYGTTLLVKVAIVIVLIGAGAVSRRYVTGRWMHGPSASDEDRPLPAVSGASDGSGPSAETVAVVESQRVRQRSDRRRGLRRSLAAELALGLAVLSVTALLVNAVPARQAASQPFTQSFSALGVQVNAIIDPARVGAGNQFHFYVLGRSGEPQAIPELDASITLSSERIGPLDIPLVVASPGHYQATSVDIPAGGSWTLKVTVRTSALDEQELFATVPVH